MIAEIPCQYRHPNLFCHKHGCHCEFDEVQNYPECPKPNQNRMVGMKKTMLNDR